MINQFSTKIESILPSLSALGITFHESKDGWDHSSQIRLASTKKNEISTKKNWKNFSHSTRSITMLITLFMASINRVFIYAVPTANKKKRKNNGHIKTFALFLKKVFCDNKIFLNSKMGIALQTRQLRIKVHPHSYSC